MLFAFENDLKDLSVKIKEIAFMLGPELEYYASDILHLIVREGIYIHNLDEESQ